MRRMTALALCATLGAVCVAGAQEPQPQPVFRGGVEVVAVDVTVVGDDGSPIEDLQPDDFTLKVDGKTRRIVAADYLSRLPPEGAASQGPRPSHYSSNEDLGMGRLIMLVIDQGHINRGNGRPVMSAASQFVDTLNQGDRVGVIVIPAPGIRMNFTTDHEAVKEALTHIVGSKDAVVGRYVIGISEAIAVERGDTITWDRAIARECSSDLGAFGVGGACAEFMELEARAMLSATRQRTAHSLSQLRGLVQGLGQIDGPKTLAYISEGLVLDADLNDVAWLPSIAATSHVTIYTIHVDRSLAEATRARMTATLMEDAALEMDGLTNLSGYSRGAMFRVTARAEAPFQRLARELSGDYLLSFEPEEADRDPRPRRISVEVRRKGVTVRARPEFRADAPTMASTATTPEEQLAEILRSPFPVTELPIRATSYTILDQPTSLLKVIVVCEIDDNVTEPAELSVQLVVLDQQGRTTASGFDQITAMPLDPWRPSRLQHTTAFLVEPGEYLLRFAAIDESGRRGSVDHRIQARLTRSGDLHLGDLMLAEVVDDPDAGFRPRVDMDGETEVIATYLELYPEDPDRLVDADVTLEIFEKGAVTDPVFEQPANLRDTDDAQRLTADATIPVSLLPPGEYVARAVVTLAGESVGHVSRPFTIGDRGPATATAAADSGDGASSDTAALGLAIDPFDPTAVLESGVVAGFLERMSALHGVPPTAPTRIAMDHARQGRFDEILTDTSPEDERLMTTFLAGLALLSDGQLEAAAGEFRASMLESSEAYPAMFYLGAVYAAGGREREAIGAWQTSLITENQSPVIYEVLTDSLMRLNDQEQAVVILQEALDQWPENGRFKRRLANAYAATGQETEAFSMLSEYLDGASDDTDALFLALRILYESHLKGLALTTPEADREHLHRYAVAYREAGGPQMRLVTQWIRFVEQGNQ